MGRFFEELLDQKYLFAEFLIHNQKTKLQESFNSRYYPFLGLRVVVITSGQQPYESM